MRSCSSAMRQDVGVGAARFFESIGEDREAVEGARVVDCLGQLASGRGEPGGVRDEGMKGEQAEDAAQHFRLGLPFTRQCRPVYTRWVAPNTLVGDIPDGMGCR